MHDDPARQWTVEALAREVGLPRAALAARFSDRLGEPPMTYLTRWRMAVAADLLIRGDDTLTSIARQVGYATPFALSSAVKREFGLSPAAYRARESVA